MSRLHLSQPWNAADATDNIREIATAEFTLSLTGHAKDQMHIRDLHTGDIKHVLKRGYVYEEAQSSTRDGWFKYRIDGVTPNSGNRTVRVVVLPCVSTREIKIITVMWRDEDR